MKKKRGRKNAYETVILPNIKEIKKMIEAGALDKEIYSKLGISKTTWYKFKSSNTEFTDFIHVGRKKLIEDIETAMYKSATGGITPIRKGMKVRDIEYENGKKVKESERVEIYIEDVYVPPNPASGKFLLMNWAQKNYTNDPQTTKLKREEFEHKKTLTNPEWE